MVPHKVWNKFDANINILSYSVISLTSDVNLVQFSHKLLFPFSQYKLIRTPGMLQVQSETNLTSQVHVSLPIWVNSFCFYM